MKTPILFLHGFPLNGSLWLPQIRFFQNKTVVLAPDLRGLGSGPKGGGPWMISDFVEDLHELLVKAKIQDVILCGHSLGGYVALEFIQQFPKMVKSLVLISTRADGDTNDIKDQRYKTLDQIRRGGLENFAIEFTNRAVSLTHSPDRSEIKNTIKEVILKNSPENVALVIAAMASRKDHTSLLGKISCPTMVVVGADDKIISWGINHSMARKIPKCRFSKISHAGHLVSLEQPEKFNSLLDTFINYHGLDLKELSDGYTFNSPVL